MEITCPKCSKSYEADTKECECGYIFTKNNLFVDWEVRSKLKTHVSKKTRYKDFDDKLKNLSSDDDYGLLECQICLDKSSNTSVHVLPYIRNLSSGTAFEGKEIKLICDECKNDYMDDYLKQKKEGEIFSNIQVKGESTLLFIGIAFLFGISFLILEMSPYILLVILIFLLFMVRIQQGNLIGNGVIVSPSQFPEIYNVCKQACDKLNMSMPKIIYKEDPTLNAFAIGAFGSESIVLNSRLIEDLDDKELEFIIGHELCHIKYKHTLWSILTTSKDSLAIPFVSDIFGIIFNIWGRKCEYTCDRGGLFVNRDIKGAIGALGKLAVGKKGYKQLNVDEFISQNKNEFHNLSEQFATHPHLNNRMTAIFQFNQRIGN